MATSMFVGVVPDDLKTLITIDDQGASVVDWGRAEPLLQHVEFGDVTLLDRPKAAEGVTEGDLEKLGYEVVAYGQVGPLILRKRDDAFWHPSRWGG